MTSGDWRRHLVRWTDLRTSRGLGLFLTAAFLFRLAFGLLNEYWAADEIQIQLIGLKFYTTGAWPFFGPDVTHTHTQIPGALQGLLVGGPMFVLPIPEAPFILVNLLSLGSLSLLAWYICRRIPQLPRWIVWPWLFTAPWTLHYGAHVLNTDYLMTGAILFWVGLWESLPGLRLAVIPRLTAGLMIGFGLGWIAQLHMSWPVLLPLVAYAGWSAVRREDGEWRRWVLGLLAGGVVIGLLFLPTLLVYGAGEATGGTGSNLMFAHRNPAELSVTIAARFLSFASYELAYWLGGDTASRVGLLSRHPWAIPFGAFLFVFGYIQPVVLAVGFFRKRRLQGWHEARRLVVALLVILFVAYNFSVVGPHSHTFYVAMPLAMFYSMFVWQRWLESRRWRRFAVLVLISGLIVSAAFMADYGPTRSLYRDRARVVKAMRLHDYHLVGERRSTEWGCCY